MCQSVFVCLCMCVCACVRDCVRACVRVRAHVHVFAVCVCELLTSKCMYMLDLEALRAMHFRLGVPNVHYHII